MHFIVVFWFLYRTQPLHQDYNNVFQHAFEYHPVYEKKELMQKYLPGFSSIEEALKSMNVAWLQAFQYVINAIESRRSDIETFDNIDSLFENL